VDTEASSTFVWKATPESLSIDLVARRGPTLASPQASDNIGKGADQKERACRWVGSVAEISAVGETGSVSFKLRARGPCVRRFPT
jgi:hypothetical protein